MWVPPKVDKSDVGAPKISQFCNGYVDRDVDLSRRLQILYGFVKQQTNSTWAAPESTGGQQKKLHIDKEERNPRWVPSSPPPMAFFSLIALQFFMAVIRRGCTLVCLLVNVSEFDWNRRFLATVSLDQHSLQQQDTLARMQRPVLGGQQQAQAIPFTPPTWYQSPTVTPINSTNASARSGMGPPSETNMSTRLNSVVNQGVTRPFSPAPNAQLFDILPSLQGKSLDELDLLVTDSKVYNSFLHSLEPVRHLDSLRGELTKGHADLARNNLTKDSQIAELRNQCAIIRTTELAAAREKFEEVQKCEKEITANFSSSALLGQLQEAAAKVDEESEILHQKLLSGDIDISEFIQKYKKERILYHRRMLVHFAGKVSLGRPG